MEGSLIREAKPVSVIDAFASFVSNPVVLEGAIYSSTIASFGGGSYSVELFEGGDYRVLPSDSIGNLYESEGLIIELPTLTDDEWDDDPRVAFYDNAVESLRAQFQQFLEDRSQESQ